MFARLAVSKLPYSADRPYDYLIPDSLRDSIKPGMRVLVPFSNSACREAVVLSLSESSEISDCREIIGIIDEEALLNERQLQLCYFLRERTFCTVWDAVRAMLPAGFFLTASGKRRVGDCSVEMARLLVPADEAKAIAVRRRRRSPRQAEILDLLADFESLSVSDLLRYTGAERRAYSALCEAGLTESYRQECFRRPSVKTGDRAPLPQLNADQARVLDEIRHCPERDLPGLLYGVTGSGKTSIYAHLISDTLSSGHTAILLVPEISLTPQMVETFSAWFGDTIALQHSGLSAGERCDEWKRIRRGEARLVIGTRSAVFAPSENLGLMILDEEQEESYRSDAAPRYHTREIARWRCLREQAYLLLGSATPDLRSFHSACTGAFSLFRLSERYNRKALPTVRIVDMKEELRAGNTGSVSRVLRQAIQQRIDAGEQSLLFLNRRGSNRLVTCGECGYIYRCPHCSVAMTWHAGRKRLICHYCGHTRPLDTACPSCGGRLSFIGSGTEGIEEELKDLFPDTAILRADADSIIPAGSHEALFHRFTDEKIPIMIGTQMIARGLNFDNVTLVGVLSADQSLYNNDYRAGERCFSLLTQVIGRCGRGSKPGEAMIQTFTPDSEVLRLAAKQDYESFYSSEIALRELQAAPPFRDWVALTASGPDERRIMDALKSCRLKILSLTKDISDFQVFGPVPLTVVRVSDSWRYRLLLSCRLDRNLRGILSMVLAACGQDSAMRGIHFYIETDPGP
ncbi:MAG: primosomal protein N' [Oscillospiraceae bacterium]|nr:primosomal protein N' [Oscillospiraceae bacterium]